MEELIEGFRRFREEAFPAHADLFHKLAHAQSPHTLFVVCSDSRVVPTSSETSAWPATRCSTKQPGRSRRSGLPHLAEES
jgi:carbonic anhydrase